MPSRRRYRGGISPSHGHSVAPRFHAPEGLAEGVRESRLGRTYASDRANRGGADPAGSARFARESPGSGRAPRLVRLHVRGPDFVLMRFPAQCITTSAYQESARTMRTTVTIDDDVFQAAQAQARASGRRLGEVLSQLARRGLQAKVGYASRNGLPVFRVAEDAPVIPSDRAQEMMEEDEP